MRLKGFGKKAAVGLGVLAKVHTRPIDNGGTNCINVPEQHISNIASSYDMNIILERMKALNVSTYQEQQDFYDSQYEGMYINYFTRNYGRLVGSKEWNEVNSKIQNCMQFEFLDTHNSTWLNIASKVVHNGDVVVPVSRVVIPRANIVQNVYGVDYLRNKVVYLDKQNYDACAKKEVDSFCENRGFHIQSESIFKRVTQAVVCIPALVSGVILGKHILSCARSRINRMRRRNIAHNFNENDIQGFEVPVRRRRVYSEWSDRTLIVDDMPGSDCSDDTLLVEEFEEFEPMDS